MPLIDTTDLDARITALDASVGEAGASAAAAGALAQSAVEMIAALPTAQPAPVPEVTQAELDALAALVAAAGAADKAEDDQQTSDIAVLASRIGSGTPSANPSNDIFLDSFTGTDDQKLTAALDVQRVSNPKRAIRLAARSHTFSQTRTTFSGLRILGPNVGWQNPEIAGTGGALPQCVVNLNCGNAGASWLVGTTTTYNVTVAGICFKSGNAVTQFYHHPYSAGTSYATRLDTLTFYGFKHVLGTPADPFSMTLNTWAGEWTLVAVQDTQFSLRGSDNWLTPDSMNYGWAGANGGKYLMRFSNLSKTAVRNLYLTARGGSRAILVEGPTSQQGGLDFTDCVVEGQNANDPAMGALIVVKGGGVSFTNTKLNFGMARPTDFTDQVDTALVMVQGGVCLLTNTWTNRATATAETVPVVNVTTGGVCHVSRVLGMGGNWTGKPLAKGAVVDATARTA